MKNQNDSGAAEALKELTTVLGGVDLKVALRGGGEESAFVRELPVEEMNKFWSLLNNEEASIELVCQKEAGWCKTLAPESYTTLADKVQEVNLPFFRPWVRRQLKWQEATDPTVISGLRAALDMALAKVAGSPLPASSSA